MKKIYALIWITLISSVCLKVQSQDMNWNLIITVDEEIVVEGVSEIALNKKNISGKVDSMSASYIPGNLKIKTNLENISSQDSLFLSFTYLGYDKKDRYFEYDYEIEIKKSWLSFSYLVIHIYNMDKKKYRDRYPSHKDKAFVYDLNTPNGARLTLWQ